MVSMHVASVYTLWVAGARVGMLGILPLGGCWGWCKVQQQVVWSNSTNKP
jgi:hypothetical protein